MQKCDEKCKDNYEKSLTNVIQILQKKHYWKNELRIKKETKKESYGNLSLEHTEILETDLSGLFIIACFEGVSLYRHRT